MKKKQKEVAMVLVQQNKFNNAQQAFETLYDYILEYGENLQNTKCIRNISFIIENPIDNLIHTIWRKWSYKYAIEEWQWYLSGNPNATDISEKAKIWKNMMDDTGCVNSNYGYQWKRNNQLDKVINILNKDNETRRASISLYDGKEIDKYNKDTICTYAIHFYIINKKLNMSVMMRSCDLVFGFCNDQFCFSNLQEMVSKETNCEVGEFHFFCNNLHIYERHYNLKNKNLK